MSHLEPWELDGVGPLPAHAIECEPCRAEFLRIKSLGDRLRALPGPVPASIDRAILLRRVISVRTWVSAAAALVLAAGLVLVARPRPSSPQDIDASGRVDIVDAYRLAVQIEQGRASVDINRDGSVDRRDVDAIARECVKVRKP